MTLTSCGLIPRSGPSKGELLAGSVSNGGSTYIINVNDRVVRASERTSTLGFTKDFLQASQLTSDIIRPGDTLGLTIWENVEDGLLVSGNQNFASLQQIQVDDEGFAFVPYVGRIKASGNTPEALRNIITNKLQDQTPDPQVEVRREAGDGATVTIMGSAGGQGIYPIERPTRTLVSMLAQAGGVSVPPEIVKLTIIRGKYRNQIWFQDLFENPQLDIALRHGDKILIEEDSRSFTILGAAGSQSVVEFESQDISALEALAQVGGLNSALADPTGVFVIRNEPESIARAVIGKTDLIGDQRVAYVLDLTKSEAIFTAREFAIRDGDTVYVTEAPIVTWNRTIQALTGSLTGVNGLNTAVSDFGN